MDFCLTNCYLHVQCLLKAHGKGNLLTSKRIPAPEDSQSLITNLVFTFVSPWAELLFAKTHSPPTNHPGRVLLKISSCQGDILVFDFKYCITNSLCMDIYQSLNSKASTFFTDRRPISADWAFFKDIRKKSVSDRGGIGFW